MTRFAGNGKTEKMKWQRMVLMVPPALQKVLVGTVNFEAVIQTASVLTLCGKISKVIGL